MTLGYGPPRALCPICTEEGYVSAHQRGKDKSDAKGPLRAWVRFECSNQHAWLTPREDAELMGAFLARQEAIRGA